MSAISREEFEAALRKAADATQYGVLSNVDAERFAYAFFAALPPDVKLVRREPLDAILEASIKASGAWVEPYLAPRESGVPTGCDILEEDAAFINAEQMESARQECRVMFDAAPPSLPEE